MSALDSLATTAAHESPAASSSPMSFSPSDSSSSSSSSPRTPPPLSSSPTPPASLGIHQDPQHDQQEDDYKGEEELAAMHIAIDRDEETGDDAQPNFHYEDEQLASPAEQRSLSSVAGSVILKSPSSRKKRQTRLYEEDGSVVIENKHSKSPTKQQQPPSSTEEEKSQAEAEKHQTKPASIENESAADNSHTASLAPVVGSSSTSAKNLCKVVHCGQVAAKEGYCQPHHVLFKPSSASAPPESGAHKEKREKKEKKTREAQLLALKSKSQTMPNAVNTTAASSSPNTTNHITTTFTPSPAPSASVSSSSSKSPTARSASHSASSKTRARKTSSSGCLSDHGVDVDDVDTSRDLDVLLTETRRAWKEANKVVFKDLPRLAKRTSVVDNKEVCILWGRRVGQEQLQKATIPKQQRFSPKEIQVIAATDSKSTINQQQQHATTAAADTTTVAATDASSTLNPGTAGSSSSGEPDTPKSRVSEVDVVEDKLPEVSTWEALTNVVLSVAEHLESPEVVQRTRTAFAAQAASITAHSDLENLLQDIFLHTLGASSRTFAVFRATHQSILFPAVYTLKTNLYVHVGQMKDVRRQDGWTIEIYIGTGRVWVTHQRWEQSFEPIDDPNHFECCWEIRVSFDAGMHQCRAVFLRIQDLKFHADMTRERKEQIVKVLKGSGYIV